MRRTQKNKATGGVKDHVSSDLRIDCLKNITWVYWKGKIPLNQRQTFSEDPWTRKLARLRAQLLEPAPGAGSGGGSGFDVSKSGDARIALVGFPSVGKSTFLSKVTKTKAAVAAYSFTTLTAIPGVLEYGGAEIQVLDLPGIIEGASEGKGRGRQVISAAKVGTFCHGAVSVTDGLRDKWFDFNDPWCYETSGAKSVAWRRAWSCWHPAEPRTTVSQLVHDEVIDDVDGCVATSIWKPRQREAWKSRFRILQRISTRRCCITYYAITKCSIVKSLSETRTVILDHLQVE